MICLRFNHSHFVSCAIHRWHWQRMGMTYDHHVPAKVHPVPPGQVPTQVGGDFLFSNSCLLWLLLINGMCVCVCACRYIPQIHIFSRKSRIQTGHQAALRPIHGMGIIQLFCPLQLSHHLRRRQERARGASCCVSPEGGKPILLSS